ncbi:MAG: hypothetical protein LJF06_16070 [Gemmatimonadetes bacterium]|nr:hypothetical protein [Gemmatimonadota bacterium]
MSGSDRPPRDAGSGEVTDDLDEPLRRGRAIAKRTFWGMMIAVALMVLAGGLLDEWVAVGVMLVGFSYPLLKVLREYRHPREFAKPGYWGVVTRVLERHDLPAETSSSADASPEERRRRLQDEMDQIRRLGPTPKSRGDGSLWPPALLALAAATAGVLYLVLGHNTAAGVAWLCMAGVVAGLGWLRKAMRGKEERALSILEEEMKELSDQPGPSDKRGAERRMKSGAGRSRSRRTDA